MNEKPPIKVYNQPDRAIELTQWFREPNDLHTYVFGAIDQISSSHRTRQINHRKYAALYENALESHRFTLRPVQENFSFKLTFNVIQSCIDAVSSKIAKNKPKPEFITTNADFRLKNKATHLSQYIDGTFYDNKLYDLTQDIFIDACIFGTGVLQISHDGEEVRYERVSVDEIYVDDYESQYRKPRQLFHVRRVFRASLLQRAINEDWGKEAETAIKEAPQAEMLDDSIADMIEIAEAWYLPTKNTNPKKEAKSKAKGAVGGRHTVCLKNHTLQDEEYVKDYFPFAFFRWKNRRAGFYGMGLAEELVPIQYKIGQLIKHIDKNMAHTGLHVFTEMGSQINPNSLSSNGGTPISKYVGTPAIAATWPAVSQEVYAWLENLYRKAFELSGISQMTAFAEKSPGVTAGVALQTLADSQTERFMLTGQRYEEFFLDIAKITIDLTRDLFEDKEELKVKAIKQGGLKEISWKDVDLEDDHYRMQVFPISSFASSPAAKLDQINTMMQNGILSPQRGMLAMGDNPDIKDYANLQTASLRRVQKDLDMMKHEGKYLEPDAYLNLPEAIEEAKSHINQSILESVPDSRVQLMRNYIAECQRLNTIATAPPTTPAPDPAAAPPPGPVPAPPPG